MALCSKVSLYALDIHLPIAIMPIQIRYSSVGVEFESVFGHFYELEQFSYLNADDVVLISNVCRNPFVACPDPQSVVPVLPLQLSVRIDLGYP